MLTSASSDPVLDVDELYRALAGRLERIVRFDVRAPEPVVEDACQFAWSRLVDHCDRVRRETALSWLATTAVREAVRLIRRQARELSLDAARRAGRQLVARGAGARSRRSWPSVASGSS